MTHTEITALASAARLALTEEEKSEYAREMARILAFGELLRAEALLAEEPSAEKRRAARSAIRADEPRESLLRDALLAAAPTVADGYVTVPRILSLDEDKEAEA